MITLELIAAAVAYICIAVPLQRKLTNMPKMYAAQAEMNAKTKELNDLAKSGASNEVLMAKQKELSGILMSSMKFQMKPLLVLAPFSILVYYVLLPMAFAAQPFTLVIPLLSYALTYKQFFFLSCLVLGLVVSLTLQMRDKKRIAASMPIVQQGTTT